MGGYYGCSNFVLKWMNALTMLLAIPVLAVGVYFSVENGSKCYTFLQKPVLVIGVCIFLISLFGFIGAARSWSWLLWLYLFFMAILILLLASFTIFSFVVTADGGGATIAGYKFKEYNLGDYSGWLRGQINDTAHWSKIKACMVDTNYCHHLVDDYDSVEAENGSKLSPTESGCCRPPSSCAYQQLGILNFTATAATPPAGDCHRWSNTNTTMCYECDSCKGGVAQYVRESWQTGSVVLLVVVVLLSLLYCVGCCARYNAKQPQFEQLEKEGFTTGYQHGYQGSVLNDHA